MAKAHQYYMPSGYYAGSIEDRGLRPGNSTYEAPEIIEGYIPRWTGEAWEQVENHKGKEGYIGTRPHTIKEYGPLPEDFTDSPNPNAEEIAVEAKAYVLGNLAALDSEYLTPRTLAGLVTGDEYALEAYRIHEEKAEPWRDRLAAIPTSEEVSA